MFRRGSRTLLLIVFSFTVAPSSAAQAVKLRGSVTDENGVPVGGVEVSLKPPGGREAVTHSDDAGHFEESAQTPGGYLMSLSKPGYFRVTDQPVDLREGDNDVSFSLSHVFEVHETVEVRSPTNQIEPSQIEHQEILDTQDVLNIPAHSSHDLRSYLPSIAGVVRDNAGGIHVAGGRAEQAEYLLDGFELGDPATGELSSRVNVDSVREVKMASGRYDSQYAHAGAGVMELNTYVGDDRWRFGTTNFIPAISLQQGFHLGNWYPRFNFSGPFVKGRIWFSDSISIQHTFTLIRELPRNANIGQQWSGDNLFRVQVNLTPRNILQGNFLYNVEADSHVGLGAFSPLSTTSNVHGHRAFVSAKDQIFVGRHVLELGAAADEGIRDSVPLGSEPYVLQPLSASGNYFQTLRQRSRRLQSIGNLTLSSLSWHGAHTVKAGFNVDGLAFAQMAARSPVETLRADNTLLLRTAFLGPAAFRLTNTQLGFYAQDSWQVLRPLFLEIGGRADRDQVAGNMVLAPRLGANFLPFHDDRTKLSIGWGIYYQPVPLGILGQGLDQQRSDILFDASGAVLASGLARFVLPATGLRQPRFKTTSMEWTQKFGGETFAGARFTHRVEGDGFAYEDIQASPLGGLFLLQNSRHDRYRSIEVWGRHIFRSKAEVYGDFTRSRADTNKALDYSLTAPLSVSQAPGPLPWDAPNRFISWGWSPLPIWELLLSYHLEYRSGFPFNAVNQLGQLQGSPGQQRFPNYMSLDLGIEKRFAFRRYIWAARISIINATNHVNPDSVNTNVMPFVFAGGQARAFTARIRLVGRK